MPTGDIKIDDPFIFTIFGASGDLAKLKIFPTIFELARQKRLPKKYAIIGYARSKKSKEKFQKEFQKSIKDNFELDSYDKEILEELLKHIDYFSGQYDSNANFIEYQEFIQKILKKAVHVNYFSVPPRVFAPIIENLSSMKTAYPDMRLILEKPFGTDTTSATKLFHLILSYFDEDQVYLLDHYLGKKAVRSILPLRLANRALNLLIKGEEISNIQISAYEDVGIEDRSSYFDRNGIIKDMIQSHLLQLFSLITMNIPVDKSSDDISQHKNFILSSLKFIPKHKNISISQYEDYPVKNSDTPTAIELKCYINRQNWYNVPILIRTGKNLSKKHTYMVIELKKFEFQNKEYEPNRIIIEFYPEEKISIKLIDVDNFIHKVGNIEASSQLSCDGDFCLPSHSILLLDVFKKDKKYFLSFEEILSSWKFTDQIIDFIKKENIKPSIYKKGTKTLSSLKIPRDIKWYEYKS